MRSSLNIPVTSFVVLGCGTGEWRKGIDLFIEVAKKVYDLNKTYDIFFIWVGTIINDKRIKDPVEIVHHYGLDNKIFFPGFLDDPSPYFLAADLFLLPSREDPFPLVALEACNYELPVVCFENSGGMPSFIKSGPGFTVPYQDTDAMAEKVIELLTNDDLRHSTGKLARDCLYSTHISNIAVPQIIHECSKILKYDSI